MNKFNIKADIKDASTLPSAFYTSAQVFELTKEKIFAGSWQLVPVDNQLHSEESFPFTLLQGFLNEPLVLHRTIQNQLTCFSNVCTHRGNILVQHPGKYKKFVCSYHGRRFGVDGKFEAMPEFNDAKNFPRDCEDLHNVQCFEWNTHLLVSLNPAFDFASIASVLNRYVGFLPVSQFKFAKELSKEYLVNAHWALYSFCSCRFK
jgi:choline monooxygenase